jgi:pyruvate/2-oxoglutarate dehydrogenase complex dihydrolipoamide acyltransferase (E2) component
VYIDQAKHEVGMLLNPGGGVYMSFECGPEEVEALGPFLSPVGPVNQLATSFTAALFRSGATQTPSEYENALGEKRLAIPMGKRAAHPSPLTTGVELSFTIQTSASLQIKAVTAAEIEAKQHEDEAAAAAAAKKRQDEEAAAAAAVKQRQEEEAKLERVRRALLSSTLTQCRKAHSKHKRVRCEKRAKRKYGSAKSR